MTKFRMIALALPLLLVATMAGTVAAQDLDAAGIYNYSTDVDGTVVSGQLVIEGEAGSYSGKLTSDMFPSIPISSITVEDSTIIIEAEAPDGMGNLRIQLDMDGTSFSGSWSAGGMGGSLNGTKES